MLLFFSWFTVRGGNPTVDINTTFIGHSGLHILDLSNNTDVVTINQEQTVGGDLLLQAPVQDEICSTFPSPYDNDYRGADEINPDDIPTRFQVSCEELCPCIFVYQVVSCLTLIPLICPLEIQPDKPVFAKLADGSYALYDSRLCE